MWAMRKFRNADSMTQLNLKDEPDPRQSFLYRLSKRPGLALFRNVLLVSSPQDHYVPRHSARIEMCQSALDDPSLGFPFSFPFFQLRFSFSFFQLRFSFFFFQLRFSFFFFIRISLRIIRSFKIRCHIFLCEFNKPNIISSLEHR